MVSAHYQMCGRLNILQGDPPQNLSNQNLKDITQLETPLKWFCGNVSMDISSKARFHYIKRLSLSAAFELS